MANSTIIAQVRVGMHVKTADGKDLGKVTRVWIGSDLSDSTPWCDEELCSRLEVHRGLLGTQVLYIPYSGIAEVTSKQVTLNVDANTVFEKNWERKPEWIPEPESTPQGPYINSSGMG